MKNLVFRFYLTVTLCWQYGNAERSDSYFYDKPEVTLFDKLPGTAQLLNSVFQFPPPSGGHYQQPSGLAPISAGVEILPGNLVYEDSRSRHVGGFGQPESGNFQSPPDFAQTQQAYRGGRNFHPIACNIQDGRQAQSVAQRPCASEPIVAQYNRDLVDLSNGGTLTRLISTCGPNNNCNAFRLQSDVNRHLGVLAAQLKIGNFVNAPKDQFVNPQLRGIQADGTPLVRPPARRLIRYTEIERDDPFN